MVQIRGGGPAVGADVETFSSHGNYFLRTRLRQRRKDNLPNFRISLAAKGDRIERDEEEKTAVAGVTRYVSSLAENWASGAWQ